MEATRTTVLVVDDDDAIRLLVKLKLELSGRIEVVAEAIDGPDALASFERLGAPPIPHVVVLDNRMPGMSGLEVATELLERVPGQRIVLYSAYLNDDTVARAHEIGIDCVSKSDVNHLADLICGTDDAD